MRYLARRYGEFNGIKIPDVLNIEKLPVERQRLETRKLTTVESGSIVVLNRVNKLNAREFVRTITEVRTRYPDKIIYLPYFGLPSDYPIIFYLGVDLLDDSPIRMLGNKRCTSEFGLYDGEGCLERNEGEKKRILDLIRLSLEHGKFRELVESHSFSNFSKEALRIVDMEFYPFIEKYMDYRPKRIVAANVEGLYRPEIVDFRKRVIEMKQTAENLLLIPCSAVKPYSRSKTHRILHSFIKYHLPGIQEVIVTSPLGLVPRELESLFPAMYYDIPVTGHWFDEEKRILYDLSKEFFKGKKYSNVFYILPEQEGRLIEIFNESNGISGNLNYENSEKLARILDSYSIKGNRRRKEAVEYSNVLKFLYGVEVKPDDISLKNEGNRQIIEIAGSPVLKKTRGGVQMMKGLAELLASKGIRTIEVSGVFIGNNVFIPGIKAISEDVKPGMEVALVHEGMVVGRGVSHLSFFDLSIERKGIGLDQVTYFSKEL
jgi:archaeosine synthase